MAWRRFTFGVDANTKINRNTFGCLVVYKMEHVGRRLDLPLRIHFMHMMQSVRNSKVIL
jgi:hypothetical protein